ncbi:YdcF family protein [Natrononativus amylolyticus]|uniref:YdcF family protein n=1 Tax=Natrononativus amylolyticus TaxID=2963434 RepID=UPI0020CECEFB|nr:YdcF family protein [Natrononativus amylolyticus]
MVVVVLGQALAQRTIHPHLRRRVDAGITALRETDSRQLVLSGGRRNRSVDRAEADAMGAYARQRGVSRDAILRERRSRDTIGNGYFTRRLLEDLEVEPDALYLVTAEWHAPRAAFVFEQCFGEAVTIDTRYATTVTGGGNRTEERAALERTRSFFEPVTPGDLEAVRRRLVADHDWYDLETATTPV